MIEYSGNTRLLGTGLASAADIDAWFLSHMVAGAGYVGLLPRVPPAAGESIRLWADAAGINSDLVAALIAVESAYLQSRLTRDKCNPSGYGAENDDSTGSAYDKATTFKTLDEGIQATVAHLADYVRGKGGWTPNDPRVVNIIKAGWLGVVRVLSDLDGRWAYPGTGYGAQIAARANDLLAHAGGTSGGKPMAGNDPRFAWTPDTKEFGYPADLGAPNPGGIHGRNGHPIELLILHITAGTDSQSWLLGSNGSSTHYLTHQNGSPRAQHVAEADAAWTPGNRAYAERSINVEVEMLHVGDWTDAIMRETARTIAPIMARRGIPAVYLGRDNGPGKRGMIGHWDVPNPIDPSDPDYCGPWGGASCHTDPGPAFDWATFTSYVVAEMTSGGSPPSTADPLAMPDLDPTQHDGFFVPIVFQTFWTGRGGLEIFGHWVSGVIEERQRLVQYSERARFEYHPDLPGSVQLGLVGMEVFAGRHPELL